MNEELNNIYMEDESTDTELYFYAQKTEYEFQVSMIEDDTNIVVFPDTYSFNSLMIDKWWFDLGNLSTIQEKVRELKKDTDAYTKIIDLVLDYMNRFTLYVDEYEKEYNLILVDIQAHNDFTVRYITEYTKTLKDHYIKPYIDRVGNSKTVIDEMNSDFITLSNKLGVDGIQQYKKNPQPYKHIELFERLETIILAESERITQRYRYNACVFREQLAAV